jgi:hypothetical protein
MDMISGKEQVIMADKETRPSVEADPTGGLGVKVSGVPEDGIIKLLLRDEKSLQEIYGSDLPVFAAALFQQSMKVLKSSERSDDNPVSDERQFMLAAVSEMQPRDAVERMLAVQMAATHVAMIRSGSFLAGSETIDEVNAHYSGYNKLARTYATQMEALRKHRSGGKQTVTVQHVNVEGGRQAIVGNVQTGGANEKR